ncbi:hypothetical protein [Acinetobacter shaoyimingii]|uniref:Uncharacterized protein n=1 Tax=Acinetobacter shaoyimingii TaxID=2715164 RepID=A0A6G8RRS1_9GAMM|nr:hypothetical protein [Acinetobacter shaoyimingii]NHB59528.1 hypothetical protein [Acinetobacter shaoyimingii]QIO04520.1 hypothetical protein G8E00_00380 [Acinetobacter shaoyimingii]
MGKDNLSRQRRNISLSYFFMFLGLLTIVSVLISYWLARKVAKIDNSEVWIKTHSLWIMRNVVIFLILAVFASLWFIPAHFIYWDSVIWVKSCTVIGVFFSGIAWLYLINQWLKGLIKYMQKKAVF